MEKRVGKVTHYFGKIGVAVLSLEGKLVVGDKVKFVKGDEDLFEQEITSMQIDHESVEKAKKKDDVAVKVDDAVKEGALVFLVSD